MALKPVGMAMSLAGRDKGEFFFVLEKTERTVLLADGKSRTLEHPKRKNLRHVKFLPDGGFAAVSGKTAFVSIHDGARPFVRPEEVDAVHRRAYETGAAICGTYAVDTVKVVDASGRILSSPDRRMLFCAATPQVFSRDLYARALAQAQQEDAEYTDDSACVAAVGAEIYTECCSHSNFKLTTPQDLLRAKAWLDAEKDNIPELC